MDLLRDRDADACRSAAENLDAGDRVATVAGDGTVAADVSSARRGTAVKAPGRGQGN
jgi:hypothetical protein